MTNPSVTTSTGGGTPPIPRLFTLDVLRGVALFGILLISIWQFGGMSPAQQSQLTITHKGGNYILYTLVSVLAEGKMRALFSIAFGAGILLFFTRPSHPSTLSATDIFVRRQMWLMVFGLINAMVLLWPGDILFQYGIMGILLFAFWRAQPKLILLAAIFTTLVFCGKYYWSYCDDQKALSKYAAVLLVEKKFSRDSLDRARKDSTWFAQQPASSLINNPALAAPVKENNDDVHKKQPLLKNDSLAKEAKKDTLTKRQRNEKDAWNSIVRRDKYDTAAVAANVKAMRGKYTEIWKTLLPETQYRESSWLYRLGIWDIGSMMLLGMALFGYGFFGARFSTGKYMLIAIIGLVSGLLLAWWRQEHLYAKLVDYERYVQSHAVPYNLLYPFERAGFTLAYASIIMALTRVRFLQRVWEALAAVGRMTFTLYIFQTIACTIFFYGYGLGNYARLSQLQLYMIVAELWLVQICFAIVWFRYFTIGPLEWVWRRLTYGRWLPIRKQDTPAPLLSDTKHH